jgi:hypothetical protein
VTLSDDDNIYSAEAGTFITNLASSAVAKGAYLVGYLSSLANSVARTVQDKVTDIVSALDFSGASVTAKLDAAIASAGVAPVLIPGSMGAGEPTSWPNTSSAIDFRGFNSVGAGRKLVFNQSDANGQNLATFINDTTSYTLSTAAGLFLSRGTTGSIPNNRNIEGIQANADLLGTLTGGGTGFVLCGAELSSNVTSAGATIGFMWGSSHSAFYGVSATTVVSEIAGLRATNVINNSASVTPARMFSAIFDDVTGNATRKGSIYSKGDIVLGGVIAQEAAAVSIASASTIAPTKQITFVSGTAVISTITPPTAINGFAGQITLIPTGAWSTNIAGNIALPTTAVVSKALVMTYAAGQWWPSY